MDTYIYNGPDRGAFLRSGTLVAKLDPSPTLITEDGTCWVMVIFEEDGFTTKIKEEHLEPDIYRRGAALTALTDLANLLEHDDVQHYAADYARYVTEWRQKGVINTTYGKAFLRPEDRPPEPQPPAILLANPEVLVLVHNLVRES
jgi:hypothetical protein